MPTSDESKPKPPPKRRPSFFRSTTERSAASSPPSRRPTEGLYLGEISNQDFFGVAVVVPGKRAPQPGQFVQVAFPTPLDPGPSLLHQWNEVRPFRKLHASLMRAESTLPRTVAIAGYTYNADAGETTLELGLDLRDPFTRELLARPPMSALTVLGPLGQGFALDRARPFVVLVAEGAGLGPMMFLAQTLADTGRPEPALFAQNVSRPRLELPGPHRPSSAVLEPIDLSVPEPEPTHSAGERMERHLVEHETEPEMTAIYAAGSDRMLADVAERAERLRLPAQTMILRSMPCATGACQGCVVPGRGPSDLPGCYRMTCRVGPVFNSEEIDWATLTGGRRADTMTGSPGERPPLPPAATVAAPPFRFS